MKAKTKSMLAGVLAGAMALTSFAGEKAKSGFYKDFSVDTSWEQPLVRRIGDIPVDMRDVPGHPDDAGSARNAAPIEPNDSKPKGNYFIGANWGYGYAFKDKAKISAGVGLDLDLYSGLFRAARFPVGSGTRRRNYQGAVGTDNRDMGSALTYYSVYQSYLFDWNSMLRPELYTKLSLNLTKDAILELGCSFNQQNLSFENGWDRYSAHEKREGTRLAQYIVARPMVSFSYPTEDDSRLSMGVGVTIPLHEKVVGRGKEMELELNDFPWIVGINWSKDL